MCESVQQNYAAFINGETDVTADLIPGLLLFQNTQCGGAFFPSSNGGFVTNALTQGQVLTSAGSWSAAFSGHIQSFDIPFNFHSVSFTSVAGRTSAFIGPYFTDDVSQLNWQNNNAKGNDTDMATDPIASVTVSALLTWASQAVEPMCMGENFFIGPYSLNRYLPQSARCDYFMTNTWCAQYPNNSECSCFKDQVTVEQKSQALGANLPVICFGQDCATTTSYKTQAMLAMPCNLTVCEQAIRSSPGIFNEGQETIFCGGQFFTPTASLATPSVSPVSSSSTSSASTTTPFYTWLLLSIAAVLFVLLIYMLFSERPGSPQSVVQALSSLRTK